MIKRWLILLLCLPVMAGGTIREIGSGDLPYTTQATGDTIRISGSSITTSGAAIIVNHANIRIEGEDKTIYFNTGANSSVKGIAVNANNLYVRDLILIEDLDTATNGNNVDGIDFLHISGCTLINVDVTIYSDNGRCLDSYGSGSGLKNIYIDSCDFWNYCKGYTTRTHYDGAAVRLEMRNETMSESDFSAKIYRSIVHISPHMGFVCFGMAYYGGGRFGRLKDFEIAYCSTYVDHQNDFYTYDDGTTGHSSANAYGIAINHDSGALIHNNYISSGDIFGGSRGLFLEGSYGDTTCTTKVYNNVIDIKCGRDVRYGALRPDDDCGSNCGTYAPTWAVRIRDIDNTVGKWIDFYDNEITMHLKAVRDTQLYLNYGYGGVALSFSETDQDGTNPHNAQMFFHGNKFEISVDSNGSNIIGEAYRATATPLDTTVKFWDNEWIGASRIMNCESGGGIYWNGDTISQDENTNNPSTYYVAVPDLIFQDINYRQAGIDTDISWPGAGSGDITLKETYTITVTDTLGQPIENCSVLVWSNVDDTTDWNDCRIKGITDENGQFSGVCPYWFESQAVVDTVNWATQSFNPYYIKAQTFGGGDITTRADTLSWNTDTATVVLEATQGQGGGEVDRYKGFRIGAIENETHYTFNYDIIADVKFFNLGRYSATM
ncbi:MAG: hypothetical protein PVJ60_00820 [Phycisphaerales bacterium]|jgi:hypothetical protein